MFLTVSSLVLLELTVRIFLPKGSSAFYDKLEDWPFPKLSDKYHIVASDTLGFELVSNANTPEYSFNTNSLGMLDKEYSLEKKDSVYRIICVGDSTTSFPGKMTFPHFLEQLLFRETKDKNFEVWKAGVPGYNLIQNCKAIRKKWINYDPDLVILGFCLNDFDTTPIITFEENMVVAYFSDREIASLANSFLLRFSALYRAVFEIFMKFKSDSLYGLEAHTKELIKIKSVLEENNIPFVLAIIPFAAEYNDYPKRFKYHYNIIKYVCEHSGIKYLDFVKAFEGSSPEKLAFSSADHVHLNKKGNTAIANKLFNYLKDNYLTTNSY